MAVSKPTGETEAGATRGEGENSHWGWSWGRGEQRRKEEVTLSALTASLNQVPGASFHQCGILVPKLDEAVIGGRSYLAGSLGSTIRWRSPG
jgi:hypothetical protein